MTTLDKWLLVIAIILLIAVILVVPFAIAQLNPAEIVVAPAGWSLL